MFEWMAEGIVEYLISKKKLDIEERQVYEYGVEVILLNMTALIGCFVISIICKQMVEYLCFLVFFVPVRSAIGGTHLKKSEWCMIVSLVMYAVMLSLIRLCPEFGLHLWYGIIVLVQLIIVLGIRPLKNEAQGLTREQEKRNKRIFEILVVLYLITPLYNFIHDNQMTEVLISELLQEHLILL